MDYGTCQGCGTVKAVTKNGHIARDHTRKEVHGSIVLTIQCRGARRMSVEAREEHERAVEAERYVPPMWGIWLIDPSGKYGLHKVFAETAETPEEAFESARKRYHPEGGGVVELDTSREPYRINPARGKKP